MFEVSERAHAGLQLMAALANVYHKDERLRLKTFADETGISPTYLEEIASALRKAELIEGRQGPGGGYKLTRSPEQITLEDISTALEGRVMLVECQAVNSSCPHERQCKTKSVWSRLQRLIQDNLHSMTLKDVM